MNRIFPISRLNLKLYLPGIVFGVLLSLLYMAAWLSRDPKSLTVQYYQYELFKVNHVILLFLACQMFIADYVHGCVKTLYTGVMSRAEILLSKVLSLAVLAGGLWIISRLVYAASLIKLNKPLTLFSILNQEFIFSLAIYVLSSVLIGTSVAVIATLLQRQKPTFVLGFLGLSVIQYLMPLFVSSNLLGRAEGVQALLYYTPNYVLLKWTTGWQIQLGELMIFGIWIGAAAMAATWLVERRSVRT